MKIAKYLLSVYEAERLLYHIKPSSPGLYHNCSYEIAHVVAHILNLSFSCGTVPLQWRQAVVTPVPKVAKPSTLSEYRPISVTPLLSRVAEKIVVSRWILPAIPAYSIVDQFAFRPTGRVCALTFLLHHVTAILERSIYARCLMIDFSNRVDHRTLLSKLNKLNLPPHAINWIISHLRSQILKCEGQLSASAEINTSIVQGSGTGSMLFVVMEVI